MYEILVVQPLIIHFMKNGRFKYINEITYFGMTQPDNNSNSSENRYHQIYLNNRRRQIWGVYIGTVIIIS